MAWRRRGAKDSEYDVQWEERRHWRETFWDIKPPVLQWEESCDLQSQGEI